MALPQKQYYTEDDYYNLPEDIRAELINGQIYYMSSPNQFHQEISGFLYANIYNYIRSKNGLCKAYSAPFDVKLNKDNSNIVQPDIMVICDPHKLDGKRCNGAPDWIIEITSPSNSSHDYIRKLNLYADAGVREYWIVNPQNQSIYVYFFESEPIVEKYIFNDKIKVNIYDDLVIDFNEINF